MSESLMRRRLIATLQPLHAIAVENAVRAGTPDVNYAEGWIELKWIDKWPRVPPSRPILINHFSPQQRLFMIQRARVGGKVWLMLKVGRDEWFLFTGTKAAEYVGRCTRAELIMHATKYWPNGLDQQELIGWLTRSSHQETGCSSIESGAARA